MKLAYEPERVVVKHFAVVVVAVFEQLVLAVVVNASLLELLGVFIIAGIGQRVNRLCELRVIVIAFALLGRVVNGV